MLYRPIPNIESNNATAPQGYPLGDSGHNRGGFLWTTIGTLKDGRLPKSVDSQVSKETARDTENSTEKDIENTTIKSTPVPKLSAKWLDSYYECKTKEANYENCLRASKEDIENCQSYFHDLKECHEKFPVIKEVGP